MNTVKALMLAGLGALSLGVGIAHAQGLSPTGESAWYQWRNAAAPALVSRSVHAARDMTPHIGPFRHTSADYLDEIDIRAGF